MWEGPDNALYVLRMGMCMEPCQILEWRNSEESTRRAVAKFCVINLKMGVRMSPSKTKTQMNVLEKWVISNSFIFKDEKYRVCRTTMIGSRLEGERQYSTSRMVIDICGWNGCVLRWSWTISMVSGMSQFAGRSWLQDWARYPIGTGGNPWLRLLSCRKFDKRFRRTVVRYCGVQVGFGTRSIAMSFSKSNDKQGELMFPPSSANQKREKRPRIRPAEHHYSLDEPSLNYDAALLSSQSGKAVARFVWKVQKVWRLPRTRHIPLPAILELNHAFNYKYVPWISTKSLTRTWKHSQILWCRPYSLKIWLVNPGQRCANPSQALNRCSFLPFSWPWLSQLLVRYLPFDEC